MKIPPKQTVENGLEDQEPRPACQSALIFDIETIGQDEERLLALAPNFEPKANLVDPAKIKADIAEKKARYIERAALDWKTAQVVLIGVHDGEKYAPITGDEKHVLESFFQIASNALGAYVKVGGHNVKSFDFPMLINRARCLGVSVPEQIVSFYRGRVQWGQDIFDTLEMFSFGDRQKIEGNGVDDICRAMGIEGKSGDGAMFPALWKSDRKAAIAYNQNDCRAEVEIARRCGFKFEG